MTQTRYAKIQHLKNNEIPLPDVNGNPVARIFDKPRLTKQERLAVECLKPRYRDPCGPFQKRKCVRTKKNHHKGGSSLHWKIKKCNKPTSVAGLRVEIPDCR